jgi:predicted metal-dependent hydrolase
VLPKLNNGFLELGNAAVPFELRRSRRRRTLGLTVTPQQVRIHAPSWTPRAEIDYYVQQQRDWLMRAWARMQANIPTLAEAKPNQVTYLGCNLTWEFHPSLFIELRRAGSILKIYAPSNIEPEGLVRNWLLERATKLLAWRLARIARRLGRSPTRFALSNAQTQWGSCTRGGHIRLNWRLVQAPLPLIDYVAAHELAHLVHLDHSPAFWGQVAVLCPDALARRATLRKMSVTLFRV